MNRPSNPNIRSNLWPAALLAATALGVGALYGATTRGPNTCQSPAASRMYQGDHSPGVTSDRNTWRKGILATTVLPRGASALVMGFTLPDGQAYEATLPPAFVDENKGRVAYRLGEGAVTVSAALQAPAGSPVCNQAPDTRFSEQPSYDALTLNSIRPGWSAVPSGLAPGFQFPIGER